MSIKGFSAFVLAGTLLMGTTSSLATPIVYTSEASWLAALGGATITTEDFESSPLGVLAVGTTDIGLFDVTISGNGENQIGIFGSGAINGSREFYGDVDDDSNLLLDFSGFDVSPMIGFAGDWQSTTSGDLLTLTINGTLIEFDNYLTSGEGDGFLGIIDTDGFTSLSFGVENPSDYGEFFRLDNVQVATSTASVPEPATLLLLGSGLLGFVAFDRRRKRQAS